MNTTPHTEIRQRDDSALHAASDLIPSVAIDRIIALRESGLTQFAAALDLLFSSRQLLMEASGVETLFDFDTCVKDALFWETQPQRGREAITKTVDGKIWHRLMTDAGMYTLMNTGQRDNWDRQLEGENVPAITLDTVLATFRQLHASKNDTFEHGVVDLFKALSWDFKTNNPCRFGKKIIVSRLLESFSSGHSYLARRGQSLIDDLAKVFYLLEGRNVPDHRVSEGAKFDAFFKREGFSGAVYDGEHFSMRYFMKGTAHITFKRPELVDRINEIIARHYPAALPPRV